MPRDAYHAPIGDPCSKIIKDGRICGRPPSAHEVSHMFQGSERYCDGCGLLQSQHKGKGSTYRDFTEKERVTYYGIDGEGIGRKNHRYIMIAAKSEDGDEEYFLESDPENDKSYITTVQYLDFILELAGRRNKVFSYAFNYDLTKGLTDLDNKSLYELFRPDCEARKRVPKWAHLGPKPVEWNGYKLNLQGTKFSVSKDGQRAVVWDLFKFFQSKFVGALRKWQVGSPELLERMSAKKDQRGSFDVLYATKKGRQEIKEYCLEECQCMAQLAHKLVQAHDDSGLTLKTYYGAGSSSTAMLTNMGIKEQIVPIPRAMMFAIAAAFVGGRFEHSVIGSIEGVLHNKDISSAYPYHTTFLPCLTHGYWRHTRKREHIDNVSAALIRYTLGNPNIEDMQGNWGPFPFRTSNGTVTFPIRSGGGWLWKSEYIAGERIFSHVQFREAWVYETACKCKPFNQIPEFYLMRLKLGKEGAGEAIKLAVNGCYGKLAQSIGNAVFNQWIWAGMITAGCRAQGLELMGMHKDRRNLLMIATDGLLSREFIQSPKPMETGTGGLFPCGCKGECLHLNKMVSKPLGGWENKVLKDGIFLARPGIYFPLNPGEDDIKDIKGRGLGKGIILENWQRIVDHWNKHGAAKHKVMVEGKMVEKDGIEITSVPRFCGAKTSISRSRKGYKRASHKDGIHPAYGQWVKRKIEMSFDPLPKRSGIARDGVSLIMMEYPKELESAPYKKAVKSPEGVELEAAQQMMLEQPDPDLRHW